MPTPEPGVPYTSGGVDDMSQGVIDRQAADEAAAISQEDIDTAVANLVASAPAALNTLDELAAALGDDANFAAGVTTALAAKAPIASPTFTGVATTPVLAASGLTGATQASRYVGATASGAPASGTFAVGDFVIDRSGKVWICTAAGSPGTWVDPAAGSGGGIDFKKVRRTAGDITIPVPGNWSDLAAASGGPGTGGFDLTLPAAAGDEIEAAMSIRMSSVGAETYMTFATIVAGAIVNTFGGHTGAAAGEGLAGLWGEASRIVVNHAAVAYTVQAGDISGGNVKIRPIVRQAGGATTRILSASTSIPFDFSIKNLGPQAA